MYADLAASSSPKAETFGYRDEDILARSLAEGFKLSAGLDQFSMRYHSWVDVILEIFIESSFGQVSRQGRYEYVWKGDSRLCGAQNLVGMGGNSIS